MRVLVAVVAAVLVAVVYASLVLASRRDDQHDDWLQRYRQGGAP